MLGKYVGVLGARTYFRGSAKPIDPAHSRYRLVIDGMEGDFKARVRGIFGGLISPPVLFCAEIMLKLGARTFYLPPRPDPHESTN
jgi:hypothetical protein